MWRKTLWVSVLVLPLLGCEDFNEGLDGAAKRAPVAPPGIALPAPPPAAPAAPPVAAAPRVARKAGGCGSKPKQTSAVPASYRSSEANPAAADGATDSPTEVDPEFRNPQLAGIDALPQLPAAPLPAANELTARLLVNQPAPEYFVETWIGPKPNIEGKMVLFSFWATWSQPCKQSIASLNQLHQVLGDQIVVVGISDEPADTVRAMQTPKIEYFSGVDTQGRMKKQFEIRGIPHAVLIDPTGIVRWQGHPMALIPVLGDGEQMKPLLAEYLKKGGGVRLPSPTPPAVAADPVPASPSETDVAVKTPSKKPSQMPPNTAPELAEKAGDQIASLPSKRTPKIPTPTPNRPGPRNRRARPLPVQPGSWLDRARQSLEAGQPQQGLKLLQAAAAMGDSRLDLKDSMRWCAALKRPVFGVYWGIGRVEIRKDEEPSHASSEQDDEQADDFFAVQPCSPEEIDRATLGSAGKLLVPLAEDLSAGRFGAVLAESKTSEHGWRGVCLLGIGAQPALLRQARERGVDLLLLATVAYHPLRKQPGQSADGNAAIITWRIFDVIHDRSIWNSRSITSIQIEAADGTHRRDPRMQQVDELRKFLDSAHLQPVPKMQPTALRRRCSNLAEASDDEMLAALAELRLYRALDFISDIDLARYFKEALSDDGKLLATGSISKRIEIVEGLLEGSRQPSE